MTLPDHGVDLLLRQATADLRPDVDALVVAGITRGRTKRRRARIGTAVATVVVFGVIGAGAAVVPHRGAGPDSARDPARPAATTSVAPELTEGEVFPDGRDATVDMTQEQSDWIEDVDNAPDESVLRALVSDQQMKTELEALTGGVVRAPIDGPPPIAGPEDGLRQYSLTVEGALVTFRIIQYNPQRRIDVGGASLGPAYICRSAVPALPDCSQQADGSWLQRADSYSAGATARSRSEVRRDLVLTTTDGWQIDISAYNTTEEKDGDRVAAEPVMELAELEMIATNPGWYA